MEKEEDLPWSPLASRYEDGRGGGGKYAMEPARFALSLEPGALAERFALNTAFRRPSGSRSTS